MKSLRILLAFFALATVAGLAYVAQQANSSGATILAAAQEFAGTLSADQKKQAIFEFGSDERFNWNFIPLQDKNRKSTRKGLPLIDMTAAQKKAALALLKAGTSTIGGDAATTIMSLEAILRDQEAKKKGGNVRDPEWYFFTFFGSPSKTEKWGWRVEGHHLSLNFTMSGTEVVASTPCFFGANPAQVKSGPDKDKRILPQAEDLARDLFKSLDAEQVKTAHQPKHFGEPGQKTKNPDLGKPVGIAAAKMTKEQREILSKLVRSYSARMPADVAEIELKLVKDGGYDNVHFAFTGSADAGKGFTYRVHGPTFVIEFLNIQDDSGGNANNHIHSCWRRVKGDFGVQ